jgi:predicted glutamine amidotransferase
VFHSLFVCRLPTHLFDAIQGHTDSEFWFMLFLHYLGVGDARAGPVGAGHSAEALIAAMRRTLARVLELTAAAGDPRCVCNFVVTEGTTVVATRMAGPGCTPASLYYASGSGWESSGAGYVMSHRERVPYAYIIASEPLTSDAKVRVSCFCFLSSDFDKDWVVIPAQSIAAITQDSDFLILPIKA